MGDALREAFGRKSEEFDEEFDVFLQLPREEQLAILPDFESADPN